MVNRRSIQGEDRFFFLEITMILGKKSERRNQSPFFFLENINFWKFLPRAPGFEYPPLCERFFGFREASDLTGTKMRIFWCNFAKFFWGMLLDHPIMVVPSALPKLIFNVT